jgi:hypothetical protein
VSVPPADVLDSLDCSELAVVDVDVVRYPNEGLVGVGDGVEGLALLLRRLVCLTDVVVELGDLVVEEDDGDYLEGDQGGDVLYGDVVLVHADVRQQVDEVQEVVPLCAPVLVVLGNRTEILLVEGDLHTFRLDFAEGILRVLHLVLLGLYLEAETVEVVLVLEEVLENDVLVLLQDAVLALDEGGEEP